MNRLTDEARARGPQDNPFGDPPGYDGDNPQAGRIQAAPSRTPRGFQTEEQAYRAGQFLRASLYGDPRAANWCREHGVFNIATEGQNVTGGILVPVELSSSIISLMNEYGVARRECRTFQMNSDTLTVPVRESGLTAGFYGEGIEITESDVAWSNVELHCKKLATLSRVSAELASDAQSVDLAAWLSMEAAQAFSEKEDECWLNGTGASSYGGMQGLTQILIDGNHAASAIEAAATHDTYAELDASDLELVQAALPQYALRGAKWFCSPVCWAQVFAPILQAGGGNTMLDIARGPTYSYLGHEVVISNSLPSSTGSLDGQVMLLFGNAMQSSLFGSRQEIRIGLSGERWFELDLLGVRATERFHVVNPPSVLGDGTTAGPMIGLIGNIA